MVARREQDNFQLIIITHDEHFAHLIGESLLLMGELGCTLTYSVWRIRQLCLEDQTYRSATAQVAVPVRGELVAQGPCRLLYFSRVNYHTVAVLLVLALGTLDG